MTRLYVPIALRWADLDAYGHVNNAVMLRLLEEARIQVFWADSAAGHEAGDAPATALIDNGDGAQTLSLIARQEIEYLAPVPYLRKPIDVQLWIGRLGGSSLEVCYEVCSPVGAEPQIVFARASTTIVLVDATTMRPRRLTEAERETWSAHAEDPIEFVNRR